MKLIGYEMGRIILLFAAEEVRPAEGIPLAEAISAVRERYNFLGFPLASSTPIAQIQKEGYKFEEGVLQYQGKRIAITEFGIFTDGMSVTARDSNDAEVFLEDFLNWGRATLGLRQFQRQPRRMFRSQLVVQFEKPLSLALQQFTAIRQIMEHAFKEHSGFDSPVNITRLDFGMDTTNLAGNYKPLPLIIERRINAAHEEERYYSEASLPSRIHVRVLEQIEATFS